MPSEQKFRLTLDQLAEYVYDVDNIVVSEDVETVLKYDADRDDETYSFEGHRCMHEESKYIIAGHPEFRFMGLVYFISIRRFVAESLSIEVAKEVANETDNKDEWEIKELAAAQLINDIPNEEMEAFQSYVYLMVSDSEYMTEIKEATETPIDLLVVENTIFPYEDSFGIKEFDEARRSVISAGSRANKLLSRSLMLDRKEEDQEKPELRVNFGW